jgi:hypothetical protein
LIPKRFLAFALIVLAMVSAIGIVNFLASMPIEWTQHFSEAAKRSFQMIGAQSYAAWLSSCLLILASLMALQVYALRRHRCDDYRGTYRIWLWLFAIFLLASIHCVTNLMTVIEESIALWLAVSGEYGVWTVPAIKLGALLLLVARGVIETRSSRAALAGVVLTGAAFSAAVVGSVPTIQSLFAWNHELLRGSCALIGNSLLLLTTLIFARFVFLQANGMITVKRRQKSKKKPARKSAERNVAVKSAAVDPSIQADRAAAKSEHEHEPKQPRRLVSPLAAKMNQGSPNDAGKTNRNQANEAPESDDHSSSSRGAQNLSRAERKRLKKLHNQQRRAA